MSQKTDFIAIGPGKAGTTWMYNVFRHHPEICVSSSKETLYFERYYNKPESWYHAFFNEWELPRVRGEISNTYIFDPTVPARIHNYNHDIKLISSLRNPVERTFSHYLYMLKVGEASGTFEEVLAQRPDLLYRGRYMALLKPYIDIFPRENLLILLFEDLTRNPTKYSSTLLDFLGVSTDVSSDVVEKKVLQAGKARNPFVSKTVSNLATLSRDFGMSSLVTKVKFNPLVSKLLYKDFGSKGKPTISSATRERLENSYHTDVAELSAFLGVDLFGYWHFSVR